MKKYHTGLVVGKFAPLHKGHEYLIEVAAEQCEKLIVISYTSGNSKYHSYFNRRRWLENYCNDFDNIELHVIDPTRFKFPNDSADETLHRAFCANYLLNYVHTPVQAVFSSETYGKGFAYYLTGYFISRAINCEVKSEIVDLERIKVPTSGTRQRQGLDKYLISEEVAKSLTTKILILGGESSGKTTLANALGLRLNTNVALEYGRELYEECKGNLHYEDMEYIAERQLYRELTLSIVDKILICDTSPLTTHFYSQEMFGRSSNALQHMAFESLNNYDVVYVCANDVPFVQDGTRKDEIFRIKGFNFYLEMYQGLSYNIVRGTIEQRVQFVLDDLKSKNLL